MLYAVVRDISQRKAAEAALEDSRNLQQTLIESAGAVIYVFDRDDRLLLCNQQFEQIFGRRKEELLGRRREEFMPAEIAAQHADNDHQVITSGQRTSFEENTRNGDTLRTYLTVKCPIFEGERIRGVVGISTDITERKEHEEALRLYANMFEQSSEAIMVTDADNRIIRVNPALERITGYGADELRGQNPHMLASGLTPDEVYRDLWDAINSRGHWQGELWDRRKDGAIYPKWTTISAIRDANGAITHHIGLFTDITERKHAEEQIQYLAHHDKLTGLLNRHSLQDRLDQALAAAQRNHSKLALMFIDMDRFKTINDTLGHHIGDQLLIVVAQRLLDSLRACDIVARLGGDEFVVGLTDIAQASDVFPVASKIMHALNEPYRIEGKLLHSSPSIGISLYPDDGDNTELLMQNADAAMYHAKAQGRNNYQFFTAALNASAAERMELEQDLRSALRQNELELHYQLQVHADDLSPCGVEALLRWRHPRHGLVPPLKFIPIAEETGLIEPLGNWVLEEACRQVAEWRSQGLPPLRMAVNLSPHQLRSPTLVQTVTHVMQRHGILPNELELEITESAAMQDPELAIHRLQALRDLGVVLAIDDFGTGYSSLAYLKLLPVHTLKIDRSFVKDIESDENDAAICASILALAHSLNLRVIAEGVETQAQQEFLTHRQCDYLQGFLFAKPTLPDECARRLGEGRRS
jgi:diguanylate cyclase (GGDEF)-like protein/PAS domain S-box-containing protein